MHIFSSFTKYGLCFGLVPGLLGVVQGQLLIAQDCNNVDGVGNATRIIGQELFPLVKQIARSARLRIRAAVYNPRDMTRANRRRVMDLLRSYALPRTHASFRDFIDELLDVLNAIATASSNRNHALFLERAIYCHSDPDIFPRRTVKDDGVTPIIDPVTGEPSWQYYCGPCSPPGWFEEGVPMCAEGLFGFTPLEPTNDRFMVICSHTFARQPLDFPTTHAERDERYESLPYDQNHIGYWDRSRVAVMFHEMHHALVPRSQDIELETYLDNYGRPRLAYQFWGVTSLSNEVRNHGRDWEVLWQNADTVTLIAIALWLSGSAWDTGFAETW